MNLKHVLITGGTGSFGNVMTARLLKEPGVEKITVFSRDEFKQHEMRERFASPKLSFVIGDIRDRDAVADAVRGVDAIFHAAALKSVPTGEFFPMEDIRTNTIGTAHVLDAAEKAGVKRVVLLSTDKAVYPVNVMGMSKALAEKLVEAKGRATPSGTVFATTRYGNVMGSRGSVIPLFIDHIKKGQDIPITDPNMTRFLLSLDDAIELVLFAFSNAQQGDLFIRKAPAATVRTLAEALLEIFGAKNKVQVVGIRGGEKIHESLATGLELAAAEDMGNYYRIPKLVTGLEYDKFFKEGVAKDIPEDYTSENTTRLDTAATVALLKSLPFIQKALNDPHASSTYEADSVI